MRFMQLLLMGICVSALGCYSTARHVANVRPALVKPDSDIGKKYRLARIVLKRSQFSKRVADSKNIDELSRRLEARISKVSTVEDCLKFVSECVVDLYSEQWKQMILEQWKKSFSSMSHEDRLKTLRRLAEDRVNREHDECERLRREDLKSGPNGTHAADTEMVYKSVKSSLLRNYSSVFTDSSAATPIDVVVDWGTRYVPRPCYASIFSYWLWPKGADQESIYHIWVEENDGRRTDEDLWKEYTQDRLPDRGFVGKGAAVRESEVWETYLLPIGLIPVPGESDWPKTTDFMRSGKGSLVGDPVGKLASRKCIQHMVFDPAVDGDVLAAAIVRVINRRHRELSVQKMMKGAAK